MARDQVRRVERGAHGTRRAWRFTAVAVVLALLSASSASSASASAKPTPDPALVPVGGSLDLDALHRLGTAPVSVMVQLSGDPVTVADAKSGLTMSDAAKAKQRAALKVAQEPVARSVKELGGSVKGAYQLVYNGLRVSIRADEVASLRKISGVSDVVALTPKEPDNTRNVPLVRVPQVWSGAAGGTAFHGEGIKLAVIDTGIDYTHADFGGPGTVAAFDAAAAVSTAPPDPSLVGSGAPRIKGGIDLVGDAYTGDNTPVPDANPLDCGGHGTHVAGTAGGSGVLGDGSTYSGSYDADTVASQQWKVGPGAAPKADLYAIRVFGCDGGTRVVVDALEWAAAQGMHVVNLSLGSSFGGSKDPDAVAIGNLADAGIIVVASSGNSGPNPYMTGSPASATNAISVAASGSASYFDMSLTTGPVIAAIEANDQSPTDLTSRPIVVLPDGNGGIALGCSASEYTDPAIAGAIVVTRRGTCARTDRAVHGQAAGAAAVVMVNNAAGFPPYDGSIPGVTIPFVGVQPADGATLLAAQAASATIASVSAARVVSRVSGFSSAGPRTGDSALKPDVTAPGEGVSSAGVGTGNAGVPMSGTSMAAPLTAGVAALVRQAHPAWKRVSHWKAAIVNTASTEGLEGYATRSAGAGVIQADAAVATKVIALGDLSTATLSYGFADLTANYQKTRYVTMRNYDSVPVTFSIASAHPQGSPHSVVTASTVTVPARDSAKVAVQLKVTAATAGDASAFRDVAGLVTFTPQGGANSGVKLSVPYYFVPQANSIVKTKVSMSTLKSTGTASATTTNAGGLVTGIADWYAWGLSDPLDVAGGATDVRAAGAQTFDDAISFGISTFGRWSNPAAIDAEVSVDVDEDGVDDYIVLSLDYGLVTTGDVSGAAATFSLSLHTNRLYGGFVTDAPLNSATMGLAIPRTYLCLPSTPCLSSNSGRIRYQVAMYSITGDLPTDQTAPAYFDVNAPALSNGMYDSVAPGASVVQPVAYDAAQFARTPALGFMIMSHDNRSSSGAEAQLLPLP